MQRFCMPSTHPHHVPLAQAMVRLPELTQSMVDYFQGKAGDVANGLELLPGVL